MTGPTWISPSETSTPNSLRIRRRFSAFCRCSSDFRFWARSGFLGGGIGCSHRTRPFGRVGLHERLRFIEFLFERLVFSPNQGAPLTPSLKRAHDVLDVGGDVLREDEQQTETVEDAQQQRGSENAERFLEGFVVKQCAQQTAGALGEILRNAETLPHRPESGKGDYAEHHRHQPGEGQPTGVP
jgi:hypothetical protein